MLFCIGTMVYYYRRSLLLPNTDENEDKTESNNRSKKLTNYNEGMKAINENSLCLEQMDTQKRAPKSQREGREDNGEVSSLFIADLSEEVRNKKEVASCSAVLY